MGGGTATAARRLGLAWWGGRGGGLRVAAATTTLNLHPCVFLAGPAGPAAGWGWGRVGVAFLLARASLRL